MISQSELKFVYLLTAGDIDSPIICICATKELADFAKEQYDKERAPGASNIYEFPVLEFEEEVFNEFY